MGSGASKKAGARPQTARRTSELGSVLSAAGITKVILIRHANAQPRDLEAAAVEVGMVCKPGTPFANSWTVGDLVRPLTPKGEEQAKAAATAYLDSMAVLSEMDPTVTVAAGHRVLRNLLYPGNKFLLKGQQLHCPFKSNYYWGV